MTVTAFSVFLAISGKRRGRICLRNDGLFQYVTEVLRTEDDGSQWWINEYPPSGLFDNAEAAVSELSSTIGPMRKLYRARTTQFEPTAGPYPDP